MFIVLLYCIILGAALPGCHAVAYTILASKEIHSLSEYRVSVSRTVEGQGSVNLEIEGKGYREAQLASLEGFSTAVVLFRIGVLNPGNYTLTARGVYGEEFLSKSALVSRNKTYCVFLHTDKTVYEAGDVVMFRLVVLNKYLKPLANIKPGMILRDSNSHVLKQWDKLPLTKGVFSEEIQIAEFPVLGDWIFEVEVNGQIYTKRILVADFVLPKFDLNIDAPEHVYYPDGSIPVTITARQFSGEEVEGELTITAYPVFYSGVIQPVFQAPLRRVEHLKGRLALDLSLGSELKLREGEAATGTGGGRGGRRLVLEASLEEALTGRRHNVSALLWLHRTRSYISYQAPKFYKPGLPYTLQAQVSDWENLSAQSNGRMMVKYGFPSKSEPMVEVTLPLDSEGRITYVFYPDAGSIPTSMKIELVYNDLSETITDILPPPGPRENLIQLSLITAVPTVNNEVHVKVNSTAPMKTLIYYVLGRGDIIISKTFQIIPARRMDELKFQATHAMAPEAVLLVCHLSETSEMEIASLQFQVQGILQNKVEVKLSPEEPEPLGNVDLRITAEPDSYVAVMAAAPSPMFFVASDHHYDAGQGDGLSMETVLAQVRSFSHFNSELKHPFREIGSDVTEDIMDQLGLVLLSDSNLDKRTPELVQSRRTSAVRHDESTRPPLAGPYAFSRLPVPPSPRVHLGALPTKTWLFANITVGSESNGLLGRRLPASPGASWGVGVWAVHPIKGLGIAAPVMPRASARPVLRVAAPRVLREGEVLALPASLTNPTHRDIQAEITLHNTRQEFRFENNNELDAPKGIELHQRQKMTIPPGRSGTVVFFISVPPSAFEDPRTITLELAASGMGLADSYEHEISILPAGEEESADVSDLLDVSSGSASANLSLPAPPRARARQRALLPARYAARAWGWALAPALAALPARAAMPPPSGYHNMLPYMDAAVLLQALDSSAQLSDSVRATCMTLMHQIYQQQLAYLQPDGSFSLHRSNNQEGSVWVTSFTTRWLGLGMGTRRRDAGVPAGIVRASLQWLAARQLPDGYWKESESLPTEDFLQQDPLVLTATTLLTFLDTKHLTLEEYANVLSKAQDWLARHVAEAGMRGPAVLAPIAAALAATHHPAAFQATNILSSMANVTDGVRWWEINRPHKNESGNPYHTQGRSGRELSTVAWAAQALLLQGHRSEATQLFRALLGGLHTGAGPAPLLSALARLTQAGPDAGQASAGTATLEFRCPTGNDITLLSVNKGNYLLVQEQQVGDKQCTVSAQGSGTVVASLKARRRTNVTAAWPRFSLDPRVDTISTAHHLQLTICVGFVVEAGEENSGPVLMEMRLPTGFDIDVDLPALLASDKVRSGHVGETLRLVLAPLGPHETCLTLGAPRLHAVAKEHPGVITVTDLDDDSRRARVFFSPIGGSSLCDVCWAERCKGACRDSARRPSPSLPRGQVGPSFFPDDSSEENSSANFVHPFSLITTFTIIALLNKYIRMTL